MTRKARFPHRRIVWLSVFGSLLLALAISGVGHAQDETTMKQAAVQKIQEYGPVFLQSFQDRYFTRKGEQLAWLRDILLCMIPLLALAGVTLYPLLRGRHIRQRLANPPMGRLFKLYATQGVILMAVMFTLGLCLFLLQFWMTSLGAVTNPQYVLQEQAITYVVDNREELVDNYSAIFAGVAEQLKTDEELSILSTILENGRQLRDDPLIEGTAALLEFLWPLLSNLFLITFLAIALAFLRRLWPDIRRMLRFPLDQIAAERLRLASVPAAASGALPPGYGYGPPPAAMAPGQFAASYAAPPGMAAPGQRGVAAQMWAEGRRLIWMEIRVVGVFMIAATLLSLLMGAILYLFVIPLVSLLVNVFSVAMLYFVEHAGASTAIALVVILIALFLIECFILFGAMFFLLVRRTLGVFRRRFLREITWREAWRLLGRQCGRFGLATGLATGLGIILMVLADWTAGFLIGADLWALGLLSVPVILLIGFNLGFWLGRGVRLLRAMW
jgi:hypothetical protein